MGIADFFQRTKQNVQGNIKICADRDSICMGDDCFSHETDMILPEDILLSQLIQQLADYVPSMTNVIWAIRSDIGVCGYIITDSAADVSFELCFADLPIKEMNIDKVMCKLYHPSYFYRSDKQTGERIEKYPECGTFLEKVKKDNA